MIAEVGKNVERKKITQLNKGKHVQVYVPVPVRNPSPADDALFQLPNVWSEPDRFGHQSSLYLSDPELKVI